jgi:uncharacterized protein (TIGR02145 family)
MKNLSLVISFLVIIFLAGCETNPDPEKVPETGTVTDAEGNIYNTVKIGNQWWMSENLKTKKYTDRSSIQNITDSSGWVNNTTGAYCIYENGNTQSPAPGLLYNWFALNNDAGLAPAGWHIPTDNEWQQLEQATGMSGAEASLNGWRGSKEGEKLKVASPSGWTIFENVWGNNEMGFTALAGGCRLPNATFGQPGLYATGFWWTFSESSPEEALYRYLDYKNSDIFRSHDSKRYGFSVRCVKN